MFITIIIFYTPGSIDSRGYKLEAKNKYHWRLEVRILLLLLFFKPTSTKPQAGKLG